VATGPVVVAARCSATGAVFPLRRRGWRFTAWVERTLIGAKGAAFELTVIERGLLAGRVIWFYLGKLFWPTGLLFIYPRWHLSEAEWWQYLFPLATVLLFVLLWALRRRWRGPLAGMLFFVGTLFPALGFCNVYPFIFFVRGRSLSVFGQLGDHYAGVGGPCVVAEPLAAWRRPVGYAICLGLLASLAGLTWRQSRMYTDIETVFRTTIAGKSGLLDGPQQPWQRSGPSGAVEAAIVQFQKALEIQPDYAEAHNNLGNALARQGKIEAAIAQYQKALEIRPDFAEAHNNLAAVWSVKGRLRRPSPGTKRLWRSTPTTAIVSTILPGFTPRTRTPSFATALKR